MQRRSKTTRNPEPTRENSDDESQVSDSADEQEDEEMTQPTDEVDEPKQKGTKRKSNKPSNSEQKKQKEGVKEEDLPPILQGLGLGGESEELIRYLERYTMLFKKLPETHWLKILHPKNVLVDVSDTGDDTSKAECYFHIKFANAPQKKKNNLTFIDTAPMIYEMGKLGGFGFIGESDKRIDPASSNFVMYMEMGAEKYIDGSVSKDCGFHLITPLMMRMVKNITREILYQMFLSPKVQKTVKNNNAETMAAALGKPIDHPDVKEKLFEMFYRAANKPWEHVIEGKQKTNVEEEERDLLKMERKSFKGDRTQQYILPAAYAAKDKDWWNDVKNVVEGKRAIEASGLKFAPHTIKDSYGRLMENRMNIPLGREPIRNNTVLSTKIFWYAYSLKQGMYGVRLHFTNPLQLIDVMPSRKTNTMTYAVPGGMGVEQLDSVLEADDDDYVDVSEHAESRETNEGDLVPN